TRFIENASHEFRGKACIFIYEIDAGQFSICQRQRMAKLVAGVALISDIEHSGGEIRIEVFRSQPPVAPPYKSLYLAIGAFLVFTSEVSENLKRSDFDCCIAHPGDSLLIRHRRVECRSRSRIS